MSKPISNTKFRAMIKSMPREEQRESLERHLRVLPEWIMGESAKLGVHYNEKVVHHLESHLKLCRQLWSEYLIENHVNKETV